MFFLQLAWDYKFGGGGLQEVKCHCQHHRPGEHAVVAHHQDIHTDHLAGEESAKSLLRLVTFYFLLLPYYFLWEEITKHSPQLKFVHK